MSDDVLGKTGLTLVEKTIFGKFSQMPLWVRIITYLLFVILYVYLLISPKVLGGTIRIITNDGEGPYLGQPILYHIEDRSLKVYTNEDGEWSIPIANPLSTNIRIEIFNKESKKYISYTANLKEIWLERHIGLLLNDGKLLKQAYIRENRNTKNRFANILFGNRLYAQVFNVPNFIRETIKPLKTKEQLISEVCEIFSGLAIIPTEKINKSTEVFDEKNITVNNQFILYSKITKIYNLSIPNEQWDMLKTINDLSEYIYERLLFNQYLIDKKIPITPSFRDQLKKLPLDLQKKF